VFQECSDDRKAPIESVRRNVASLCRRCADDVPRGAREGEDAGSILRFERTSLPKAVSSPDMIGLRVIG
jgi:hypothetical protein